MATIAAAAAAANDAAAAVAAEDDAIITAGVAVAKSYLASIIALNSL